MRGRSRWQFFDNFVVMAVIGHGLGFVLRRLDVPAVLAVPALVAVLAWIVGMFHYRDSYTLMLPTGDTLELFRSEIELVQQQFRTAVAPVIYGGGWDVLDGAGLMGTGNLKMKDWDKDSDAGSGSDAGLGSDGEGGGIGDLSDEEELPDCEA